ncbi:MAG: M28 family peptidase [Alphaproteobacteria bacterium]|nr:M28 family peptidase [Alphaproteobacteria bacterium]
MSEDALISDLSFDNVQQHMEHICLQIPSRLAGTENARRAAEYNADALRQHGIAAEVHDLPGLVSFPEPTLLRVLNAPEEAIEAFTCGHSVPTAPEGLSGELVYVGSGAEADYAGRSVAGKIILAETSYHPARHEKLRIAAGKGVIGVVLMNWGGPDNTAVPFGSVKPAWGNPTRETIATEMPTVPAIGIARTAGLRLVAKCEKGPVKVRFQAIVENGWRDIQVTSGEVPSSQSDDFVLLGGHQDSWFGQAATDNAAGNACIVELARVINLHRDKLKRGLVCGFWTAHETGTMVGSSWFADRNWDRLRDHGCAYMQIDQPACVGTTRWGTGSNVQLRRFHQSVEARQLGNMEYYWHRLPKGGDASFMGLGIPSMYGIGHYTEQELKETGLARLGWWHHSIECNMDKIDLNFLATHLKVYAGYLWGLCTETVLPFEFTDAADQFVDRLVELQKPGQSIGLDGALQRARDFQNAANAFDTATDVWRGRYTQDATRDDAPAHVLNETMKRVNRLLIPLASTAKGTYGHDPYGYTPQGSMIPVLHDVPQLNGLPEDETRWMLETELVRARNLVADTMTDATAALRDAVVQVS